MSKKLRVIISITLSIIIIICLTKILDKSYKYYKANQVYEEIRYIKDNSLEVKDDNSSIQDEKLKELNSDYKFWISIPNTVIDYPVVQSLDNEFYLNNNFYKEKSISGSVFLDYDNDISDDKNLILYGHNMRNGSMFAEINKFKEKDFFSNGVIKIIKNNKEYTYEVFSVFVSRADDVNLQNNFSTDEEFNEYISEIKKKSMYNKNIEGTEITDIITLYTCSYEFDEARTIVCAVLKN